MAVRLLIVFVDVVNVLIASCSSSLVEGICMDSLSKLLGSPLGDSFGEWRRRKPVGFKSGGEDRVARTDASKSATCSLPARKPSVGATFLLQAAGGNAVASPAS